MSLAPWALPWGVDHGVLVYSTADGHPGRFQALVMIRRTSLNMQGQHFVRTEVFISLGQLPGTEPVIHAADVIVNLSAGF